MIPLRVAAAVIERAGLVLVTRRPPGVDLAGLWEFPGGKCHAGETLAACLMRELLEELRVAALVGDEILATRYAYPDRDVDLHFFRCALLGEPEPQLGQEMRWVDRHDLERLAFPPADAELVRLLAVR